MIHIYYGQDKNNIKFEKMNINLDGNIKQTVFDGDYDKLLDAILQQSLFGEESVYLIDDAFFCLGKTNKDQDLLNNLLKSNKDIYCFCYDDKIVNKPHGITYHKVAKFNNLSKQKLINILLNKLSIGFDNATTKQHFETIIDNDPFVINNELTKLSLSTQNNIITRTQIDNFVSISNNPNIFQMMTFLLQNNKKQLIKLYENLILSKYQPIDLISIINTQLLNFKIYKLAKSKGWSDNDIINRLLFNQYTIMSYSNLHIDLKTINNLINELWLLEYNMKHNNLNQYLGFKFFLAK